jgi:predicted MFS family arabinose efflux permease
MGGGVAMCGSLFSNIDKRRKPMSSSNMTSLAVGSRRHRRAFWLVAFAYLMLMAFSTVPSPLYSLYRARDHFSLFMVTVIYAVYAVGVVGALLLAGHLSDWYGRRRLILSSLGFAIISALVFLASESLGALLVARLVDGVSVGTVLSAATAYMTELSAVGRPEVNRGRAQLTTTAVNVGGLGVGALAAGVLAQWVAHPLTVPYLVFLVALVLGAIGVAVAPETREGPQPRPRYRPQRLSVPHDERSRFFAAALSTFMAFAAVGLFTGLAGLFLAVTLHHPSLALAGAVIGAMFAGSVAAQILSSSWPVVRVFEAGMATMIFGLGVAVLAVWLHQPSLGLFIFGGVLIGGGGGAIFKGAIGTVLSISSPDRIAESLAGVFLSAYIGLSLPVVGAGITLARHVSPKTTLLGFAIAVTVGITASAIKLVGGPTAQASSAPTPVARVADIDEPNSHSKAGEVDKAEKR